MARTNPYLTTRVLTASPEQLRLMLYDGALRFCDQARRALECKQYEDSYNALVRAQKIVLELSSSLKHERLPDVCGKLASLYTYIYRKLVDANTTHDIDALDEAIKHIRYDRETWVQLMQELQQDSQNNAPPRPGDTDAPYTGFSSAA